MIRSLYRQIGHRRALSVGIPGFLFTVSMATSSSSSLSAHERSRPFPRSVGEAKESHPEIIEDLANFIELDDHELKDMDIVALCKEAINDPDAIKVIFQVIDLTSDEEFKGELFQVCVDELSKYGNLLDYVDQRHHTHELVAGAIKSSPWAIKFVREDLLTDQLFDECVDAIGSNLPDLQTFPVKWRTIEKLTEIIRVNGEALSLVDPKDRTDGLCLMAVRSNPHAIRHVEKVTPEIYDEVAGKDWRMLIHIPNTKANFNFLVGIAMRQHTNIFDKQ